MNNLKEPIDLPLILERILQAGIPTESTEEVILTALVSFGVELEMSEQYKFVDELMNFRCPNMEVNDIDIDFLLEGWVSKEKKGEWKSFKLPALQSFWRLLPEVLYNHEEGRLFPELARVIKRLVELLRCELIWGRVVALFALFNMTLGI